MSATLVASMRQPEPFFREAGDRRVRGILRETRRRLALSRAQDRARA